MDITKSGLRHSVGAIPCPANAKFVFNVLVIFSNGATPLPIPNREVKPVSTDDSFRAKVGDREDNKHKTLQNERMTGKSHPSGGHP